MIDIGFVLSATRDAGGVRLFARSPRLVHRHLAVAERDGTTVVLIGRLHYRGDPLARLAGRVEEAEHAACRSNDAALARAVYADGGIDALGRLEGDFALAILDRTRHRVAALRDPLGAYPLYWSQSKGTVVVSTSLRPFADHGWTLDLDEEFIADFFANPSDSLAELPVERTPYRGISRVRPGAVVEIDLAGGASSRAAWDWARTIEPVAVASLGEAGARVRAQLESAVAERLSASGGTAAHFSGGFDSTGVALLAGRLLHARGSQVDAVSLLYARDPVLSQDRDYIDEAVRSSIGLRHHGIDADDILEFDDVDARAPLDEPSAMAAVATMMDVMNDAAETAGADTMLVGHGADHLFFHHPDLAAASLLRKGRVGRAVRVARTDAGGLGGAMRILAGALPLLLPTALRLRLARAAGRDRARFDRLTPLDYPPWLRAEFLRAWDLPARTPALQPPRVEGRPFGPADVPFVAGDWFHWNLAVPRGIVQTRPYFDPRVMALAMALPEHLHMSGGVRKPVLAAALDGVLPSRIIHRIATANFNMLVGGYARHAARLRALAREAPVADGIVDRQAIVDAIERVPLGLFADARAVGRLSSTISFLHWMSTRDAWTAQRVPYLEGTKREVTV